MCAKHAWALASQVLFGTIGFVSFIMAIARRDDMFWKILPLILLGWGTSGAIRELMWFSRYDADTESNARRWR